MVLGAMSPNMPPVPAAASIASKQPDLDAAGFAAAYEGSVAEEDFLAGIADIADVPAEGQLLDAIAEVCDDNDEDHQVASLRMLALAFENSPTGSLLGSGPARRGRR